MRIITINVNGVRSAARKGFFEWVKTQNADIICFQELKAQAKDMESLLLENYYAHFHYAEKKGYGGVGIYSRYKPSAVVTGLGWSHADQEGRYVAICLGDIWIASIYLPSGTSGEHRQSIKYDFLAQYENYLKILKLKGSENSAQHFIICGDINIAHKNIDLKNWRSNQKTSGFLPPERAWLDKLFSDELGFIDAFREVNQESDQYTWWSHRGQAWSKNVGWRIDYQIITKGLKPTVKSAIIYKKQRFSDHAPLIIDYDIIPNLE